MTAGTNDAPTAAKVDPETFALRSSGPRVVRFKRGLIIGIAAVAIACLALICWWALQPRIFHLVAPQDALSEPDTASTREALSALPSSYSDVPKLGPPLPGDLGKPILERQQALAGGDDQRNAAIQQARALEERRAAELKTARESAVLVQREGRSQPDIQAASSLEAGSQESIMSGPGMSGAIDPAHQKLSIISVSAKDGEADPHLRHGAVAPNMLMAGSVISASLITGLNSDLPGFVTAQVTETAFDSATGLIPLVPQGARLIGRYDNGVTFGQKRALIIWQRIIFPDGSAIKLEDVPATDASGFAGLSDQVDAQSWALVKGAALSTLLGVGAELQFSSDGNLVRALRQSTQQSVTQAGDKLTSKALDIQPTIRIRPGTPVRLVVQKDLILAPWRS